MRLVVILLDSVGWRVQAVEYQLNHTDRNADSHSSSGGATSMVGYELHVGKCFKTSKESQKLRFHVKFIHFEMLATNFKKV